MVLKIPKNLRDNETQQILYNMCNELLGRSRFVDCNLFCHDPYLDTRSLLYLYRYKFITKGLQKRCYYSFIQSEREMRFSYFISQKSSCVEVHVDVFGDGKVGITRVNGATGVYVVDIKDTVSAKRFLQLEKMLPFVVGRIDVEVPAVKILDPNIEDRKYELVESLISGGNRYCLRFNFKS